MAINLALCTPSVRPGAIKFNTDNIIDCIKKAKKADLIVFPRLSVTGATCGSMYSFPLLQKAAIESLNQIVETTSVPTVVGLPILKGSDVFDCIAIIQNGKPSIYFPSKGITYTSPNSLSYGNDEIPLLQIGEHTVKIASTYEDTLADITIVPTAYPSFMGALSERIKKINSYGETIAVVSCGQGESVSGKIMSGDKIVCGGKLLEYKDYNTEMLCCKVSKTKAKISPQPYLPREISLEPTCEDDCKDIFDLMGRGIIGRMTEIGTNKVILGLSGGLDSTNVLTAAVLAFDKNKIDRKNIICVTMRGLSSSGRTQNNANLLIENYKVSSINAPIDMAINLHMRSIQHSQKDVVYENAQARERTQTLLDLGNKYNALVLGTGDLSEICLGWSTFGGDQLSQYNPNCSLTKTAIRKLLEYYITTKHAKAVSKIIADILDTPVSPELLDGQDTEAILGSYTIHDFFIKELISKRRAPSEIIKDASNKFNLPHHKLKEQMTTFLTRLFRYQFKRNFGPDGVQITPYDLTDLIIRSDFNGEVWLNDLLKTTL